MFSGIKIFYTYICIIEKLYEMGVGERVWLQNFSQMSQSKIGQKTGDGGVDAQL